MAESHHKRIDRFLQDALREMEEWLNANEWYGKELECTNLFAHHFLAKRIHPDAAITDLAQVRIEGGVKQPEGFIKLGARKDIVIWRELFQTAWDKNFHPIRSPWVVMEWKATRPTRSQTSFNAHDEKWILGFSRENPKSLGYVVSVDFIPDKVQIRWKKAKNGEF